MRTPPVSRVRTSIVPSTGEEAPCDGGGQAEDVLVPCIDDGGPQSIPAWLSDEDAVLLTDALATGFFGARLGDVVEGDIVGVLGAGPVGLQDE